jgi:predicted DsbA family dithiol-disulfide isomerase
VKVEIWSDVVCPWCYIGKRRFETALASFEHRDEIEVVYRSYQLDPGSPADFAGSEIEYLAQNKGIPADQAAGMLSQVTDIARSVGLEYRFDRVQHANTFDAHRVVHLAQAGGRGYEMVERLFRGYFLDGAALSDAGTLARLAGDVGMDVDATLVELAGGAAADAVRADEAQAAAYGITSVPFFVLDEKYAVAGAQEPAVLVQVLQQAWAERDDVPADGAAQTG